MKQFRNFIAEQKHINEIGPVGATIAGVLGLIGGYKAVTVSYTHLTLPTTPYV